MGRVNPVEEVNHVKRRGQSSSRGSLTHMMSTYNQHGADNLGIWLTNAKEAAAKIREATNRKRQEKKEKYVQFVKDMHQRLAESSKKMRVASGRIPPAKTSYTVQAARNRIKIPRLNVAEDTEDMLKQASRMEDVRSFLESQLRKKTKTSSTTTRLRDVKYRECMIHATKTQNEEPPLQRAVKRSWDRPSATMDNEELGLSPIVKPFLVMLPTTPVAQKPELVKSEPCTPRALDGWNIPTSFSALDMRCVEEFLDTALEASPKPEPEPALLNSKGPPLDLPTHNDHPDVQKPETLAQKLSAERKLQTNARLLRRAVSSDPSTKGCERLRSKSNAENESLDKRVRSQNCNGTMSLVPSPTASNLNRSDAECTQHSSDDLVHCPRLRIEDGVTTCSMGVVVLRGRHEYEVRGQAQQYFSDVWKCAMLAERRCASERAHLLFEAKKKRLEQLQIEKQQSSILLRQRALQKQRIAVQTHLELVAELKARREGVIMRNRVLEKKRFANALRAIRVEKLQGYGLQIPPLCDCNHGEDPMNFQYIKKCHRDCRLHNNFADYTLQLESTLQHLLDELTYGLRTQNK
ncbi:hypothetical protein MPTK2_2g15690 [Marchantia polymorpha subsp. ruderalis]